MTPPQQKRKRVAGLGRVIAWYVVLGVLLVIAVRYVPFVRDVVSGARLAELEGDLSRALGPGGPAPVGEAISAGPWNGAVLAGLSMLGALAIMVPVTWVYMLTRRHRGYEESVVHTLLILPVAVTGIVMIVQDSVALAFSLAGIVAAVRFRFSLDQPSHAMYIFAAIAIGLGSGIGALGIAAVISMAFVYANLAIWKLEYGKSLSGPFFSMLTRRDRTDEDIN